LERKPEPVKQSSAHDFNPFSAKLSTPQPAERRREKGVLAINHCGRRVGSPSRRWHNNFRPGRKKMGVQNRNTLNTLAVLKDGNVQQKEKRRREGKKEGKGSTSSSEGVAVEGGSGASSNQRYLREKFWRRQSPPGSLRANDAGKKKSCRPYWGPRRLDLRGEPGNAKTKALRSGSTLVKAEKKGKNSKYQRKKGKGRFDLRTILDRHVGIR